MQNWNLEQFSSVRAHTVDIRLYCMYRSPSPSRDWGSALKMSFTQFETECLNEHNRVRAKHGAPPLSLSKVLNKFAQDWADYLAKEGKLKHRDKVKYGENVYSCSSSDPKFDVTGKRCVTLFYVHVRRSLIAYMAPVLMSKRRLDFLKNYLSQYRSWNS